MVKVDIIFVERNLNGSWVLSHDDDQMVYYGGTLEDALRKFKKGFGLSRNLHWEWLNK